MTVCNLFRVRSAASTPPSAAELTSWVGTCPGKDESAEQNHSSRSAKGNKYLRRVLNQAAHAAVAKKGSHFQVVFRRLLPRLGYRMFDIMARNSKKTGRRVLRLVTT